MRGSVARTIAAVLVLTACVLTGCGGGSERRGPRRPARVLLQWTLQNPAYGNEELTVLSNGRARYVYEPNMPTRPGERAEATMSSVRFRSAREALARAQACNLRSQREGESGEPRGTLRLNFPDQRCTITLWDGEWRIEDDARDVFLEIEKLRDWLRDTHQ